VCRGMTMRANKRGEKRRAKIVVNAIVVYIRRVMRQVTSTKVVGWKREKKN